MRNSSLQFEAAAQRFLVGRDFDGRWVARDEQGHTGGVFVDRAAAIHFALAESNRRPGAIRLVPALSLFN
jgi:hypothetical protein